MKLRFQPTLPPLDNSSRLPLLLTVPLLAVLGLQLLVVEDVVLPTGGPIGIGEMSGKLPAPPSPKGGAPIAIASIFAPAASHDAGKGQASPLSGPLMAGSIRVGSKVVAVVQEPGGRTRMIPLGGRIGTWTLRAVRASDALLVRGNEKITVPFGTAGTVPATVNAMGSQQ